MFVTSGEIKSAWCPQGDEVMEPEATVISPGAREDSRLFHVDGNHDINQGLSNESIPHPNLDYLQTETSETYASLMLSKQLLGQLDLN